MEKNQNKLVIQKTDEVNTIVTLIKDSRVQPTK